MIRRESHPKSGFTLIELLVVISIISLLSSVVMTSLNTARAKARDAQRSASIRSLQTALEMYFNDNGRYPSSPDAVFPGVLTAALTPTYINSIPVDPNPATPYHYYNNNQNPATFYAIRMRYETKAHCYVCAGQGCMPGTGWWAVNMCQ